MRAYTPDILNCDAYLPFWITWWQGSVAVGYGEVAGIGQIVVYDDPAPAAVSYLSFLTGWGATGDWEFFNVTGMSPIFLHLYVH